MNLPQQMTTFLLPKLSRALQTGKPYRAELVFFLMISMISFIPTQLSAGSIKISWNPNTVKRGSVVLVSVESPVMLMAAEAATGEDRFPLIKTGDGTYGALVGIDVRTKEQSVPVDFSLFPFKGGPPYRVRADLMIRNSRSDSGRIQKLSLPSGMVDLSQKRIDQVKEDNRTLGDILSTRSRARFWKEGFLVPVNGRITTRFGTGRVLNGKPRSPHSGVDIAGKKGTPIKSSNSGKVILAADFYLSGRTVVVDHGWGISTIYAHMNRIRVQEGQEVSRGQVLGTVGSTGRATGPHLHFGAFIRGAKVDPLQLVSATNNLKDR